MFTIIWSIFVYKLSSVLIERNKIEEKNDDINNGDNIADGDNNHEHDDNDEKKVMNFDISNRKKNNRVVATSNNNNNIRYRGKNKNEIIHNNNDNNNNNNNNSIFDDTVINDDYDQYVDDHDDNVYHECYKNKTNDNDRSNDIINDEDSNHGNSIYFSDGSFYYSKKEHKFGSDYKKDYEYRKLMVENEYKIESIKMKARPIMLRVDSTAINLNSVETLR